MDKNLNDLIKQYHDVLRVIAWAKKAKNKTRLKEYAALKRDLLDKMLSIKSIALLEKKRLDRAKRIALKRQKLDDNRAWRLAVQWNKNRKKSAKNT